MQRFVNLSSVVFHRMYVQEMPSYLSIYLYNMKVQKIPVFSDVT